MISERQIKMKIYTIYTFLYYLSSCSQDELINKWIHNTNNNNQTSQTPYTFIYVGVYEKVFFSII